MTRCDFSKLSWFDSIAKKREKGLLIKIESNRDYVIMII